MSNYIVLAFNVKNLMSLSLIYFSIFLNIGPGADAVRTSIESERSSSQWTAAAYDPPSAAAWLTQPPSFGLTGIDYFDDPILNTLVPMGGDQCQEVYNLTCCDPIASSSFPPLHIPSSSLSSSQSSCDGEALRPLPHTG